MTEPATPGSAAKPIGELAAGSSGRTAFSDCGPSGGGPAGLATRRAAVELVHAVLAGRHPLDESLAHHTATGRFSQLAPRDRAHARLIVATTLRRLGQIDAALAVFLTKGLPAERGPLREILRTAAAQLMFLDAAPHAVVSLAVTLAKEDREARRYEKLANAVLRRLGEQAPGLIAAQDAERLNTPDWLWRSWVAAYGEDVARRIARAHLSEAPLDLSVKADAAHWATALEATLLPTGTLRRKLEGRIEDLPGYAEGRWWVQDAAAALPARLLGDVGGKRVLDLCAAPGGKTAQLAAAGAHVTALDLSEARLDRLRANLARLGLEATIVAADATSWLAPEPFDAVLLDAPCTATGTIRRHPDIPHLKRPDDVAKIAGLQTMLLSHAMRLVRVGGTVVYCTCSLQPEEGADRIAALLAADPTISLSPITAAEFGGSPDWITPQGMLRSLPCHDASPAAAASAANGLDGFFAARLVRME
jgi:16S rRNA (cytosine967-C5)-methyltransferase